MNVESINTTYQKPIVTSDTTDSKEQKKPERNSEISKLDAEIKQAEAEMKETMKEVQKATAESIDGSSEKVQILQSKIIMQQQAITIKQMQIKEIKSPKKSTTEQVSANINIQSKIDQYIAGKDASKNPDNVYRLEKKDGTQKIIFNRPEN